MVLPKRSCQRRQGFEGGSSWWPAMAAHFVLMLSISPRMTSSREQEDGSSISRELLASSPVQLNVSAKQVVMGNGLVQVTFANPGGHVIGINYGGIDNLLETQNKIGNRGYLDVVGNWPGKRSYYDRVGGSKFSIIAQTEDIVEISFVRPWDKSSPSSVSPFIVDKRFIVRRNIPGFYSYAIFDHPAGGPEFDMFQARVVYKLNGDKFHYMAISDHKQRVMPTSLDRARGKPLAYPEAVLLTDPSNPQLKGEVDDKYQYSSDNQDVRVYGWIGNDPIVGFWMISVSDEFRTGGPVKQDLTAHVGPTLLNTFISSHYAGVDIRTRFTNGEAWKKVFGPFMVYLNSNPPRKNYSALWEDAKRQMLIESESWPYNFTKSEDFPPSSHRGIVSGQLLIRDRYVSNNDTWANSPYVGLAAPGEVGSWQTQSKGYQFWARADTFGSFMIKNVGAGVYNLYAWVPGIVGDYKYDVKITVSPGSRIELGSLVYEPPRSGPTLWEIGIPDRTAAEFYVPDASPQLVNKLFTELKPDRFRQYGLWDRYAELYPQGDLVYNIGTSDFSKDWFFAHVTRRKGNSTHVPTTWQIKFELQAVSPNGTYTLQLALASATYSRVQVRFNDLSMGKPLFTTTLIGSDNAIARHGIHGLYHLYTIKVPGNCLRRGSNILALTQANAKGPFEGVMYDYIRLEGPPSASTR